VQGGAWVKWACSQVSGLLLPAVRSQAEAGVSFWWQGQLGDGAGKDAEEEVVWDLTVVHVGCAGVLDRVKVLRSLSCSSQTIVVLKHPGA
jgi:hypothetical protein